MEVGIKKTQWAGHGCRESKDASVLVAVKQVIVCIQEKCTPPLGNEIIAGNVGAPVRHHFGHVAQA